MNLEFIAFNQGLVPVPFCSTDTAGELHRRRDGEAGNFHCEPAQARAGRVVLPSAVPIIVFALLLFVLLALAGVVLLSLALRYRAGTARRQARRWVATLNVWLTSFSALFFLSFSLLLSFWLDAAFRFAFIGMVFGAALGLLGLGMTRWENRPQGLFYTPSRWLAIFVTLVIAARLIYGWWRATHSRSNPLEDQHWLISASGTQLSLAVAAGLIGYYLVYSIGVRLRVARYEQQMTASWK